MVVVYDADDDDDVWNLHKFHSNPIDRSTMPLLAANENINCIVLMRAPEEGFMGTERREGNRVEIKGCG